MSQPEARIVRAIKAHLELHGAFMFKVHGSPLMMAGLPDLVGCIKGRFIGVEVKTAEGSVSKVQRHVLAKIRRAGGVAIVARSVDDVRPIVTQLLGERYEDTRTRER